MDKWDEGYYDGLRDAMLTVRDLADERPDMPIAEVVEVIRHEHNLVFTPARDADRHYLH